MEGYLLQEFLKKFKGIMKTFFFNILLILLNSFAYCETKIGILGDSNTYWHFVSREDLFYSVTERSLNSQGYNVSFPRVEAACKTNGLALEGLERLKLLLDAEPEIKILVISLGVNDGLLGFSIPKVSESLEEMIIFAMDRNIKVLLGSVDIYWFPSAPHDLYYKAYFSQIYNNLSHRYPLIVFPFIHYEFFLSPENHIGDGLHGSIKGHKIWAQILEKNLKPLLVD